MKKFFSRIAFVAFAIVLAILSMNQVHSIGSHVVLGMALTANITQAWKLRIEAYLQKLPIYLQALTNKHYEGEMKQNGTLNIISIGEISTGTYTGADITFDTLATTGITFTLDQLKYFAFQVLDYNTVGSAVNLLEGGSKKAAEKMARTIDDYIASLYTNITTNVYGSDATPIIVGFDKTKDEVLPSVALSVLMQKMAEANADQSNPKAVIPPWFGAYLFQEFGRRYTPEGDSAGKAGVTIGKLDMPPIAGFSELYVSNNVPNTASALYKVMAGTPDSSITFATALENVETGRLQNNFGGFVKGLNIYGGKIPYEAHMALGTFNVGTPRQD